MKDKSKNIIILEIIALAVLLGFFCIGNYNNSKTISQKELASENQHTSKEVTSQDSTKLESGDLIVTFFDVGKGDCMLIETKQGAVMIDTGYEENGDDIVSWLQDRDIDSLQYLILTHPDKDHIGGADIIIDNMNVANIIETNCVVDSEDYLQYKQAALNKGIDILTLTSIKEIDLGGATFTLYPPISNLFVGQNDYSIVTKMVYGETDFLFAGDAEEARIDEILKQIPDIKSMVLKVPHHGKRKENSEEFFEAVSPKYSIITADKEKMFKETKEMLQNLNSSVYETVNGDITVISDGKNLTISQ